MNKTPTATRPDIGTISCGDELKKWYWLKDELIAHAKVVCIKRTGGKFIILDRLAHFLDTGDTIWPGDKKPKTNSKFDWHTETLGLDTLITDSYKNSQNVRRFFREHAGAGFKFNIVFMDWMKTSIGKTLGNAVDEYRRLQSLAADPDYKTDIKPHNQFNQYTRDFLSDNPDLGLDDVRRIWALKRALPSRDGRHIYERNDLDLGGE